MSSILQSGNLYSYCSGNPINRYDRTGNEWDYLRVFVDELEQLYGWTDGEQYEFTDSSVTVNMGGGYFSTSGFFGYDGAIWDQNNNTYEWVGRNINGSLYLGRTDFYDAMGINYVVYEADVKITNYGYDLISSATAIYVAYATRNVSPMIGLVAGDLADEALSYLTIPDGNYKARYTIAGVYNPGIRSYDYLLTIEYYSKGYDYNGNYVESLVATNTHYIGPMEDRLV